MAFTIIGSSDNKAAKLWAKALFRDVMAKTYFGKFMGEGSGSIVQILSEPNKNRGDKVTVALRMQPSGLGVEGQTTLEGNEEDLTFYDDALYIDLMRYAAKSDVTITQQRVEYDLRAELKSVNSEWWAKRLDSYMLRYLTGDTSLTFAANTGRAADTAHDVYVSGTAESQVAATSTYDFSIAAIDKAKYIAETVSPQIRPINIGGESYYALVLHPRQAYDLRASTATGAWLDLHKSEMTGGKVKDNPIWTGALGIYNGCIIYVAPNMPTYATGASSATVARAVLLGAQAGVVAFGMGYSKEGYKWNEQTFDYGKNVGVATSCVWGMNKTRFNSQDYGVVTIFSRGDAAA